MCSSDLFMDQWGFAVRPDLPTLALTLTSALTLLRHPNRPWLAGAVAGLALLTKLTAVALPVAAFLWLAAHRRWRDLVLFCSGAAGVTVALGSATQLFSGGQAFSHTVLAQMLPLLTVEHAFEAFSSLPRLAWFPFLAALIGLGIQVQQRRANLSAVFWVVSLGVGLYKIGRAHV